MRVLIRTDSSFEIGTGHVVRCLTLAESLRESGANVDFISRQHEGNLFEMIAQKGFKNHILPRLGQDFHSDDGPAHARWIGADWEEDARDTKDIIESLEVRPDWLLVDHYGLDCRWEGFLKQSVDKIIVIDDLADRKHDCDILLDQNIAPAYRERYRALVPERCRTLLGPDYAILQPIYGKMHNDFIPRSGIPHRLMVSFGGIDRENLTGRTLEALTPFLNDLLGIDVVISRHNPHFELITGIAESHSGVHIHSDLPTLANLMSGADLAIGASGTTNWERLCLGLPAIIISTADNQRAVATSLDREGLARWIGHVDEISERVIQDAIRPLIESGLDESWSISCHAAVDGKGVLRVKSLMFPDSDGDLQVRRIKPSDEDLVLNWANDPTTRKNSLSTRLITVNEHRKWFGEKSQNENFFMVENRHGTPIGQVRFEWEDSYWEINYALDPFFRGLGLGIKMFSTALGYFLNINPNATVVGRVKVDNLASRRIFESLGFLIESENNNVITYFQKF